MKNTREIAEFFGIPVTNAYQLIGGMRALGVVEVTGTQAGKRKPSNLYSFNLKKLEEFVEKISLSNPPICVEDNDVVDLGTALAKEHGIDTGYDEGLPHEYDVNDPVNKIVF